MIYMIYHIKFINKNLSHRLNLFHNSNKKIIKLFKGQEREPERSGTGTGSGTVRNERITVSKTRVYIFNYQKLIKK